MISSASMATRQRRLILALALLLPLACDGGESTSCPGAATRRCRWNEATQQFDRDCAYTCALPADAGRD